MAMESDQTSSMSKMGWNQAAKYKKFGVILKISNKLTAAAKPRSDINGDDSVQTIWIEIGNHDLIIGGIYR